MTDLTALVHVLLVEDDPGDAELIRIALAESTRPKFRVSHAVTLADGLVHLQSGC